MAEVSLLTIKDVQEITQLGRTTIYELMRSGELPFLKIGRSVRVRRAALDEWLGKQEVIPYVSYPKW